MRQKLAIVLVLVAIATGLAALVSPVAVARGCTPDPNPGKGKDGCSVKCGPCDTLVCDPGGKCPFHCEPIPGCVP